MCIGTHVIGHFSQSLSCVVLLFVVIKYKDIGAS